MNYYELARAVKMCLICGALAQQSPFKLYTIMKYKMKFISSTAVVATLILSSCGGSSADEPTPPTPSNPDKTEISINPSVAGSRATDTAFEQGDRIGLYVVNYKDNTPGALANTGNQVNNMAYTYSGIWTPDTPVYWLDNDTRADFYLYYPYTAQPGQVNAMPFAVKADQSTEAAYKASDFIAGKASGISPTAKAVIISSNHLMSLAEIEVVAGNGFTAASLAEANVNVKINGLKTESNVDLATLTVTPRGNAVSVTPFLSKGVYRALIVPQTVAEGNLITVTIDGKDFNFKKGFTFAGGKLHRFTITVSKTSTGINVNINGWESDGQDNGGTAE